MHQRRQDQRRVGRPAGDDDLRAAAQHLDDRLGAQVGVGGDHAAAHLAVRPPAVHVIEGDALRLQLFEAGHQIVAADDADRQGHPRLLAGRLDRLRAALRVDAAGVDDHLDSPLDDGGQRDLQLLDEVVGVPGLRVACPLPLQNDHGDLGQEVHGHVVDRTAGDLPEQGFRVVAPVAAGVCDPYDGFHRVPV